MSLPIVEKEDVPTHVNVIEIYWFDKKKAAGRESYTITKHAVIIASEKGGDAVNVRRGMHSETKQSKMIKGRPVKNMVPDRQGMHHTAEYRDKKTRQFKTWHHYFKKGAKGMWALNMDASAQPNPLWWEEYSGKSDTKSPRRGGKDLVWAWKADGKQYVKVRMSEEEA